MADQTEVFELAKDLPFDDLQALNERLSQLIHDRALEEIVRREEEMNSLRQLAGLKKRPVPKIEKPKGRSKK